VKKVSIIIPIYNSETYLKKCLNSVINQSYNNLQIILVNDGSTDSSKAIIDEYASKDKRIVAIHKYNGGIGSAYIVAFELNTVDYVLFVDSDDWLELNAVESLVKLAVDNDADMVSFGIRAFNPQGEEVKRSSFENIDLINTTNEAILKTHFEVLRHPTLVRLYKRELFKDIIVFEQNIGIDEMLTPQLLAKCNRAVYTSEVYYNVLIRQDSVCRAEYNEKKILQTIKVNRFVCDFMLKNVPKYAIISQTKYLNTLFGILHQSNYDSKLMITLVLEEVANDIKLTYKTVNGTAEFKTSPFRIKILVYIMVNFPIIYKLIFKGVKITRASKMIS
jgi:glycosyltransferase involved in cell wall biosynthesis